MHFDAHLPCDACDGAGTIELSTDHIDSRGEHYTREHTVDCDHCGGEGRVWVTREADASLTRTLLAALTQTYRVRVSVERLAQAHEAAARRLAPDLWSEQSPKWAAVLRARYLPDSRRVA
jgi:hypothetical protein